MNSDQSYFPLQTTISSQLESVLLFWILFTFILLSCTSWLAGHLHLLETTMIHFILGKVTAEEEGESPESPGILQKPPLGKKRRARWSFWVRERHPDRLVRAFRMPFTPGVGPSNTLASHSPSQLKSVRGSWFQ